MMKMKPLVSVNTCILFATHTHTHTRLWVDKNNIVFSLYLIFINNNNAFVITHSHEIIHEIQSLLNSSRVLNTNDLLILTFK